MAVVKPPRIVALGRAAIGGDRPGPMDHLRRDGVSMDDEVNTADKDGVYVLADGTPVRIKEGEPLPLGAKYRGAVEEPEESPRQKERRLIAEDAEARMKTAAPENRATASPATTTPKRTEKGGEA